MEFAQRVDRVRPSAIRELLMLEADPEVVSFGGGYPDASMFPMPELNETFNSLLRQGNNGVLQYCESVGLLRLREQIAERSVRDGTPCRAEDLQILQGAQQGLDLVAKLALDPGDVLITEDPTFLGALIAFNPMEPKYVGVRTDADGMDTDHLEEVLSQNSRAKLIYVIPDFQNPTGATLSMERRARIVELANQFDVLVLEDSPYREFRYDGHQLPTLKSLDVEGRVIFLGSFSKILAPGMRLGWAQADGEVLQKLGLLKLAADTQCSTLNMAAASLYMDTFDINEHIARMRGVYRRKRDVMLGTLASTLPEGVNFTRPHGGLFTWLTFPEGFDADTFMREALLPKEKVAYVPGGTFFVGEPRRNFARMSYSSLADEVIVDAVTRMSRRLKVALFHD